ncbi:hypothetical protein [Bartonella apihabitans]|uniref:hypothetical protein n=1 Tax=Bartonella apihabitans TaxID=2750929 RepID=UPI00098ED5C2|nr:hypothetical protein [Bartonella apihabitans]
MAGNFSFAFRQENISGYVHMTLRAFIGIADSVYLIFLLFTSRQTFPARAMFGLVEASGQKLATPIATTTALFFIVSF